MTKYTKLFLNTACKEDKNRITGARHRESTHRKRATGYRSFIVFHFPLVGILVHIFSLKAALYLQNGVVPRSHFSATHTIRDSRTTLHPKTIILFIQQQNDLSLCLGLGCVLCQQTCLFFLFLLKSVFLPLTLTTAKAFGGQALVPKRGPRSKVFASLAPLDLESVLAHHPNIHVAERAQTLVLGRNDGKASLLVGEGILASTSLLVALGTLFVLVPRRARTRLTAHDTTSHALRQIH